MRLLHVAQGHLALPLRRGPREARAVIERRAGAAYEPRLAELAVRNFDELLAELDETRMWEQALEIEPFPQVWIAGERIDAAFAAIAAITGLKSPWLREHSTGVAELAEAAAWRLGLPAASVTLLRRAALAHDLGRVGVSNAIWEKPGAARVRRVGARAAPPPLHRARLRPVAGARSDRAARRLPPRAPRRLRLPPRHARRRRLDQAARILAAADCYGAMREARPYRPALDAPAAEAELLREASEGRLDPDAVDAVLDAAGHRVRQRPRELPAGLTERELEVLLVLVRGESNQAIAEDLGISAKTVGHHVQHVYEKAGVRSRAAATLWAFEQDLVRDRHRAFARCGAARPRADTRLDIGAEPRRRATRGGRAMILATTHGRGLRPLRARSSRPRAPRSAGSTAPRARTVFRDPNEDDRVWVLFDWDAEGWQSFVSDPEVPPIMQEAGHKGRPQVAELGGSYDA